MRMSYSNYYTHMYTMLYGTLYITTVCLHVYCMYDRLSHLVLIVLLQNSPSLMKLMTLGPSLPQHTHSLAPPLLWHLVILLLLQLH